MSTSDAGRCKRCSPRCLACTGPTSSDCITCVEYKVYYDFAHGTADARVSCSNDGIFSTNNVFVFGHDCDAAVCFVVTLIVLSFVIFSSTALRSVRSWHRIKRSSEKATRRRSFVCLNTVITSKIASCAVHMLHEDFSWHVLMLWANAGSSYRPSISMCGVRVTSKMVAWQRPI